MERDRGRYLISTCTVTHAHMNKHTRTQSTLHPMWQFYLTINKVLKHPMCNHLWSSLSVVNDNGLVSIGTGHEASKDRHTRVFEAASPGNLDTTSLTQANHSQMKKLWQNSISLMCHLTMQCPLTQTKLQSGLQCKIKGFK